MWFDQRNGTATRGFDQVEGIKSTGSAAFQKGGGLGGVALLAVAAPVEIGNRVWLDADLNGRQDADEPAINGAVVELWTADANGDADELVASRTTSTINGQPGTYYFRTDDPDVTGADGAPAFVDNSSYVLVFKAGSTLTLAGPNAGHAGFAGLAWDDLQLTDDEVRVTPTATNGGTTAANDSNPDPDTGEFALSVGGPGQNNHTYDAGWYGVAPFEVLKTVSGPGPEDATYDVEVTSAVNFRGQDRLTQEGSDPHGRDPQVDDDPVRADARGAGDVRAGSPIRLHAGVRRGLRRRGGPAGRFDSVHSGSARRVAAEGAARRLSEQRWRGHPRGREPLRFAPGGQDPQWRP